EAPRPGRTRRALQSFLAPLPLLGRELGIYGANPVRIRARLNGVASDGGQTRTIFDVARADRGLRVPGLGDARGRGAQRKLLLAQVILGWTAIDAASTGKARKLNDFLGALSSYNCNLQFRASATALSGP